MMGVFQQTARDLLKVIFSKKILHPINYLKEICIWIWRLKYSLKYDFIKGIHAINKGRLFLYILIIILLLPFLTIQYNWIFPSLFPSLSQKLTLDSFLKVYSLIISFLAVAASLFFAYVKYVAENRPNLYISTENHDADVLFSITNNGGSVACINLLSLTIESLSDNKYGDDNTGIPLKYPTANGYFANRFKIFPKCSFNLYKSVFLRNNPFTEHTYNCTLEISYYYGLSEKVIMFHDIKIVFIEKKPYLKDHGYFILQSPLVIVSVAEGNEKWWTRNNEIVDIPERKDNS